IGRGDTGVGLIRVAEIIDRAAALLRSDAPGETGGPIRLDPVSAALLDVRFDVVTSERGFLLRAERPPADGTRTLLGKPTQFVGRARELGYLETLWRTCITEPAPCAVVVTAAAGIGKSRL